MTEAAPTRIAIVGASLAGLRGAEALRELGFDGELTIVGAEPDPPYDRPPLSKQLLAGEIEPADTSLRGADALDARWRLGDPAVGLDMASRSVTTASGATVAFDRLLIATGSRPRRLPVLDPALAGIHELRTRGDALTLREALSRRPRLVVVGAGLIGIEVASTASRLGLDVEIVSLEPPLAAAGPLVARMVAEVLADHGIALHAGRSIAAVQGAGRCERLVLDDGTRLEADLVLSAVGAAPAVEWLSGGPVTCRDGVVCDAWCAVAGVTGVAAAGDVARWPNPLFGGRSMRVEHWTNAAEQARVAAATLLHGSGAGDPYAPIPSFWSDHFGLRLQSIGLPELADEHQLLEGDPDDRRFVVAARRDGRLVGAVAYGMPRALIALRGQLFTQATGGRDAAGKLSASAPTADGSVPGSAATPTTHSLPVPAATPTTHSVPAHTTS